MKVADSGKHSRFCGRNLSFIILS